MKVTSCQPSPSRRGFALLRVMVLSGVSMLVLGGALTWVSTSARLTGRNNEDFSLVSAAEAATEKILTRVTLDYQTGGESEVYQSLATISVFQFSIFYGLDLDLHSLTTMNVIGRVHCNGTIHTHPSAPLNFMSDVTSVGKNLKTRKPGDPVNIIYVADRRTTTGTKMNGVRVINGQTLPSRGLTVATMNPLHVKGHYNQPTSSHLGTSQVGSTPFAQPGDYYEPPARNYSFDLNFVDAAKLPPGTPMVRALIRNSWAMVAPNTTNIVTTL